VTGNTVGAVNSQPQHRPPGRPALLQIHELIPQLRDLVTNRFEKRVFPHAGW
jgi:hypothetical protein